VIAVDSTKQIFAVDALRALDLGFRPGAAKEEAELQARINGKIAAGDATGKGSLRPDRQTLIALACKALAPKRDRRARRVRRRFFRAAAASGSIAEAAAGDATEIAHEVEHVEFIDHRRLAIIDCHAVQIMVEHDG